MIEQRPRHPRVSLVEAVMARWLLELSGRQFFFDAVSHYQRPEGSIATAPDIESPAVDDERPALGGESAHGEDLAPGDERFPGLTRFRGLLESGAGHLAAAKAAETEQRRAAAVQARALAAFAAQRPAAVLDRPDGEVGAAAAASRAARPAALTQVSEWAVDEVMVALGLSSGAAAGLLADSVTLDARLPATLDALEAGVIGWAHARALAEIVGPVKDEARAGVEARLLGWAGGKTVAQLRVAARRAVLRADAAAAARRLAAAIRDRSVRMFPGRDGMGSLAAVLTLPVARACRRALQAYAEDCRAPGDERTLDQRMADCLADLILRPGINPPVQIGLTVVAGVDTLTGGDEPGEVDGHPVPALLVRELAYTLGLLPRPDDPAANNEPDAAAESTPATEPREAEASEAEASDAEGSDAEGSEAGGSEAGGSEAGGGGDAGPDVDGPAEAAHPAGSDPAPAPGGEGAVGLSADEAALRLAELLGVRALAGTALAHLPAIAIIDEVSGQLLALTDATTIRHAATCGRRACRTGKRACTHPPHGPGLGPPPDTDGYSPSAPLQRYVRARDRRCRFPGCRAAAIRCDLDHNQPWPAGPTSADNLCCLCRHHHRLSHQAPGWTMTRLPDGDLRWTTPGGDTITTHPPRYGTDDGAPPPTADPPPRAPTARPIGIREHLRRWPPAPQDPNDPAPF